jgi:hypothetical protein
MGQIHNKFPYLKRKGEKIMAGLIRNWLATHGLKRISFGNDGPGVLYVQKALLASGAQLDADSEWGDVTEAAVKRFQSAHDLPPVGYVGLRTSELLDKVLGDVLPEKIPASLPSVLAVAPWISYMRAITGTKELPGEADSSIILSWTADIAKAFPEMAVYAKSYKHDATPWCGLALAYTMAKAGIKPAWGRPVELTPGCVLVFSRAGGGHVTTCEKVEGNTFWCRGGNQSDMVNVIKKARDSSFVGARWPSNFDVVKITGDISNVVNEGSFA